MYILCHAPTLHRQTLRTTFCMSKRSGSLLNANVRYGLTGVTEHTCDAELCYQNIAVEKLGSNRTEGTMPLECEEIRGWITYCSLRQH